MSFTKVKALKPPRSAFNLSYEKKFDCDFGQLIPVCCEEMVPGDVFKFGNEIVIRFQPMFAPILQEINAYVHYFFVPTRLIWDQWEEFITGGVDGPTSEMSGPLAPRLKNPGTAYTYSQVCGPYSLYDYFGFPVLTRDGTSYGFPGDTASTSDPGYFFRPLAFPWRCYNLVYNEYYMDETLQEPVDLDQPLVLNRNWAKDYFTSALHEQQRGIAPALPISGILPITLPDGETQLPVYFRQSTDIEGFDLFLDPSANPESQGVPYVTAGTKSTNVPSSGYQGVVSVSGAGVNLAGAATIDVADLRLIYQVQKWMERNERSGVRYTEFLHAHYSVSPRDDRLQRPEYLGGSKSPIIVSEVIQTSETSGQSTPTGRLYGKAITADRNYVGSYHAKEFGYLIGIMSVMPKATYQQGVDRQWLRKSRWDWFSPNSVTCLSRK